jgi:hypothetical protein
LAATGASDGAELRAAARAIVTTPREIASVHTMMIKRLDIYIPSQNLHKKCIVAVNQNCVEKSLAAATSFALRRVFAANRATQPFGQ